MIYAVLHFIFKLIMYIENFPFIAYPPKELLLTFDY